MVVEIGITPPYERGKQTVQKKRGTKTQFQDTRNKLVKLNIKSKKESDVVKGMNNDLKSKKDNKLLSIL